jgi:hypothetical protein
MYPAEAMPTVLNRQSAARDAGERAPASAPVGMAFPDAELNAAYAVLATRFPEETFSRAMLTGGNGPGKLQIGFVAALVAAIILIAVRNFS